MHVAQYTSPDGRTQLRSVGVLLAAPPGAPNPAHLPPPLVRNAVPAATNATLVPALLALANASTAAPLLVYVSANVSLGASPPLPPGGVLVRRPLVLVGLASAVTSINLQMVVNQLNETGSPHSNVTFLGVFLENLAPGDIATSGVATPFSIAVANNVWAAYYNRCGAAAAPRRACGGPRSAAHLGCGDSSSSSSSLLTPPEAAAAASQPALNTALAHNF